MTKPLHDPADSAFELHALTQTLAVEDRSLDESLLAVGVAPLVALKPVRPTRKLAERALPIATVLLAFTSIALAAHEAEHHSDDHGENSRVLSESLPAKSKAGLATQQSPVTEAQLVVDDASANDMVDEMADETASEVTQSSIALPARTSAVVPQTRRTATAARVPTTQPVQPSSDRSFEELMAEASGSSEFSGRRTTEAAPSSLPLRPTTGQVSTSFRSVGAALRQCDPSGEGVVTARVTVNGATGRPSAARVEGASGAVASCMQNALMNVRVDPFEQSRLEVTFPYRL